MRRRDRRVGTAIAKIARSPVARRSEDLAQRQGMAVTRKTERRRRRATPRPAPPGFGFVRQFAANERSRANRRLEIARPRNQRLYKHIRNARNGFAKRHTLRARSSLIVLPRHVDNSNRRTDRDRFAPAPELFEFLGNPGSSDRAHLADDDGRAHRAVDVWDKRQRELASIRFPLHRSMRSRMYSPRTSQPDSFGSCGAASRCRSRPWICTAPKSPRRSEGSRRLHAAVALSRDRDADRPRRSHHER